MRSGIIVKNILETPFSNVILIIKSVRPVLAADQTWEESKSPWAMEKKDMLLKKKTKCLSNSADQTALGQAVFKNIAQWEKAK